MSARRSYDENGRPVWIDLGPSYGRPSGGPIGGSLIAQSIAPRIGGGAIPATRPAPVFHIKQERAPKPRRTCVRWVILAGRECRRTKGHPGGCS